MRSLARVLPFVAALALAAPAAHAAGARDIRVASRMHLSPRLTRLVVTTPALDFPAKVDVLLPTGYKRHPHRRYPVLYLLHGSFDDQSSWTRKGDTEKLTAGLPLVVVMPQAAGKGQGGGWASDWRNEGRGGPPRWETLTIGDLVPWIDRTYRTKARRGGRAIAGLSMGGFSAMSYAVRHPDLFVAASSYSGAVDTNNSKVWSVIELETLADGGRTPDAIWGPRATDEVYWRAHNPADLAGNLAGMVLAVRTGNGQRGPYDQNGTPFDPIEEGVHEMSVSFHQQLDAAKVPHLWDDYGPGTHSWPYWHRDLQRDLPRFMRTFAHPPRPPSPFSFRSADPAFSIYGWRVSVKRPAAEEFADLERARPRGFTLRASGNAQVVTPGKYRPRRSYAVNVGGRTRRITADRLGRLHIAVSLGSLRAVAVTIR
jgi:S-formylglutathione hydrolase FrmB